MMKIKKKMIKVRMKMKNKKIIMNKKMQKNKKITKTKKIMINLQKFNMMTRMKIKKYHKKRIVRQFQIKMNIINQFKIKVILVILMKSKINQSIRFFQFKTKKKKQNNSMKQTKQKKIKMKISQIPHKKVKVKKANNQKYKYYQTM